MSLHEEAAGILGTHVTWEDVEDEVRQSFGTQARFGENKKATNIGDMKGFMSKIALIEPDWTCESENLPEKFVIKISSQLAFVAMSKLIKFGGENGLSEEKLRIFDKIVIDLHNREVEAYRFFSKTPQAYAIPLIKIYGSRKFSAENPLKAFLISEYVENVKNLPIYESLDPLEVEKIIKNIAKFSSFGEIFDTKSELNFAAGPEFLAKILTEFGDDKLRVTSYQMLRQSFPEEYRDKVDKLIEIYRFLMSPGHIAKLHGICDFLGFRPVLLHGDLWPGNLLFTEETTKLRAIIDWQAVCFGAPAQDSGRFFITVLSAENRRKHLNHLLEVYYQEFVENVEKAGAKVPYTFEQLRKSYQLMFPLLTTMVLPGILRFANLAQGTEEEKLRIHDLALEKAVGMMEDVIQTHQNNLIEFSDFYNL
ncbi:unnamed protein product [Caenorhabditis angaria]|uniref:CHK kinase-like domain-containing protein n=1 Tax=Caenorhabditis angaria TaxID=860376 RepID=A0A9P1N9U9_9PELO|nr:unnamed protein product [Caenorhabditis angaria]